MKFRVVIDTNVLVSALLFRRGRLAPLRLAWSQGLVPLVNAATVLELRTVLAYAKFRLTPPEIAEALALYIPYTERVTRTAPCPILCRDPRDQPFLDLAQSGAADWLISGDADLLALQGQTAFTILDPAQALQAVEALR